MRGERCREKERGKWGKERRGGGERERASEILCVEDCGVRGVG